MRSTTLGWIGLAACMCVAAGCSKHEQAPPPAPTAEQPQGAAANPPPTPAAPAPSQPAPPNQQVRLPVPEGPPPPQVAARAQNALVLSVEGQVDAFLTTQLQSFVRKEGRLPNSFSEFASTKLDSIPRPPEGKKWVIDVVNLQVKAVAAGN